MTHKSPPTYTDYNTPSPDILFVLRNFYQTALPFLADSTFDDLAENYDAEEPEDFLDALGQELTCFQHVLYELSSDSDSYALTILPEDKIEEFKAELKVQKQKAIQRKQPRRKAGTPAKRIDLGKRLPCDKIALAAGYRVHLTMDCIDEILWLDYNMTVANDTSNTHRYCSAFLNIKEWQCVHKDSNLEWSAMKWFEGELYAADQNNVYHIKNIMDFAHSCEKVLELQGGDSRLFPKFFILGDRLYLFMHQCIYEWRKKSGIFRKGFEFKKIYTIDGFNAWDFVPVGNSKVAFQMRPKSVPRGETESKLTLLDLATGKENHYNCHYGYVRKWTDSRICVSPIDVTSKMPIVECFDFKSGEKKNLVYGALGNDSVSDIYETSCGTILEGRKNIYRTTGLWEFMESAKD